MLMTNSKASVAPRVWADESSEQSRGMTVFSTPVPMPDKRERGEHVSQTFSETDRRRELTSHDPADHHLGDAEGACLDGCADCSKQAGNRDALEAANLVAEDAGDEGADQRAAIVDRNDTARRSGVPVSRRARVDAHKLLVVVALVDASHDALIVSFEAGKDNG